MHVTLIFFLARNAGDSISERGLTAILPVETGQPIVLANASTLPGSCVVDGTVLRLRSVR